MTGRCSKPHERVSAVYVVHRRTRMRRDIGIKIQLQCADRERMRTCAEQDAAALACADALNGLCAGFAALAEGTEPV